MININYFNLLGFIHDSIPKCLNCGHQLGSDGDGLVYCAYCLDKDDTTAEES